MPELGPQTYTPVNGYFDDDGEPHAGNARRRREAHDRHRREAGKAAGGEHVRRGIPAGERGSNAVATSRGLFAYHRNSDVDLSTTVRTPDATGSGWASAGARDWSLIDPAALGRAAARKAVASRRPKAIEPGLYTVVLEPQAVADIMPQLIGSFNARANDEGRGTFSKQGGGTKLGEKIADERVTIYSDPTDPDLLAQPFDAGLSAAARGVRRERRPQELLVRSLLGAEEGQTCRPRAAAAAVGGGGGGGGGGGWRRRRRDSSSSAARRAPRS